jgi:hypothetical protein
MLFLSRRAGERLRESHVKIYGDYYLDGQACCWLTEHFWGPDTFGEFDKIQARLECEAMIFFVSLKTSVQSNSPSSAFERLREIANTPRIKRNSLTTPNAYL